MRNLGLLTPALGLLLLCGCGRPAAAPELYAAQPADADSGSWLTAKTQPAPGHVAKIAPTVLHPVEQVLVQVGDRVKKDQPLVKIDEDEPKADMLARKAVLAEMQASLARLKAEPRHEEQNEARANLESLKIAQEEARQILGRLEPLYHRGSVSEQRYHEVRHQLGKSKADGDAAAARLARLVKRPFEHEVAELEARITTAAETLKSAQAELEHYTVTAMIDGVITSLDVCPGTVSRPGTTVWGEILDLSVIDVRCDVPPETADSLHVGQAAEVRANGRSTAEMSGKIAVINIAADPKTGRVPVLVRLNNPDGRLRCYVEVKVRFN